MNIRKRYGGSCNLYCSLRESEFKAPSNKNHNSQCLQLDIPLVFTEVSTVDLGISQARVTKAYSDNLDYKILTRIQVKPFEENRLSDTIIESRPIRLTNTDNADNNPLVFSFCIEPVDLVSDLKKVIDHEKIFIEIDFTFSNLSMFTLKITVEPNLSSSELSILKVDKLTKSYRVVISLILLMFYVIGATTWSYNFNSNIHLQDPANAKIIGLLLGSLVAFLGISLIQIKSWTKTIANISGFFKYPEIHLSLSTHKFLTSIFGIIAIFLFIFTTGCLVYWEHSMSIPNQFLNQNFTIYDSKKEVYLEEGIKRIYLSHLKTKDRFQVFFNSIRQNSDPKNEYVLGVLNFKKGYKTLLSANFSASNKYFIFHLEPPKHFTYSSLEEDIIKKNRRKIILNALKGKYERDVQMDDNKIIYSKKKTLSEKDLYSKAKIIGSNVFNAKKEFDIYKKRHEIYSSALSQFQKLFSDDFCYISEDILVSTTKKIINETGNGQTIISCHEVKNYILLRALWASANEFGANFDDPKKLDFIANYGKGRLVKLHWPLSCGHRPVAALWEFLLEIENLTRNTCGTMFHHATIGLKSNGGSWLEDQKIDATARLMRACLKLNSFEIEKTISKDRTDFFLTRRSIIKRSLGETADDKYIKYYTDYFDKIGEPLNKNEEQILRNL